MSAGRARAAAPESPATVSEMEFKLAFTPNVAERTLGLPSTTAAAFAVLVKVRRATPLEEVIVPVVL